MTKVLAESLQQRWDAADDLVSEADRVDVLAELLEEAIVALASLEPLAVVDIWMSPDGLDKARTGWAFSCYPTPGEKARIHLRAIFFPAEGISEV